MCNQTSAGKKSHLPSTAEEGNKLSNPSQDPNPSVHEAPLVPELGRVEAPTTEVPLPDVTFDDVKDRKDAWFTEWTMTMDQDEEWKKWGKRYLMKKFRFPARYADRQMGMIGLMWGLKFSDFKFTNEQDTTN